MKIILLVVIWVGMLSFGEVALSSMSFMWVAAWCLSTFGLSRYTTRILCEKFN